MMKTGQSGRARRRDERGMVLGDAALRDFLDHIAREIAEEYVRLMREPEAPDSPEGSD